MQKLYNYLTALGIEEKPRRGNYTPAAAEFYRQTYGEQGYFETAPGYTYPGAVVALDYNAEAPAEYFKSLRQIETKLERYCRRNNYACRRDICHYSNIVYYFIEKQTDRENASNYYTYRDASIRECDAAAHELYTSGHPEKVNETLRAIMQKWGAAYNDFLAATANA